MERQYLCRYKDVGEDNDAWKAELEIVKEHGLDELMEFSRSRAEEHVRTEVVQVPRAYEEATRTASTGAGDTVLPVNAQLLRSTRRSLCTRTPVSEPRDDRRS